MRAAPRYRYVIVNRSLSRAVADLESVIRAERLRLPPRSVTELLRSVLSSGDV